MTEPTNSDQARFFAMVSMLPDAPGCWLWTGPLKGRPEYPSFWLNGKNRLGHRVSWEWHKGPISGGLLVCHRCDIRECVNPEHLFLGTYLDNRADCVRKLRHSFGERSGPRRHPERFPRGVQVYQAKLTDELVREIRSSSATTLELARRIGVKHNTVIRARERKSWRHV